MNISSNAGLNQSWLDSSAAMMTIIKGKKLLSLSCKFTPSLSPSLSKSLLLCAIILLVSSLSACGGNGGSAPADTGDTTAPNAPLIISPATDVTINNGTPTVSGTAEANSAVELFDTDGTTSLGTSTADASGDWSITTVALAEGTHSLTAKATDAASNTSTASTAVSITVDTIAPDAPVITSPTNGATIITNTPTVSGTAEVNSSVELFDTDGTTSLGATTADASGNWSITTTTLADSAHSLTAKATDAAGHTSTASTAVSITVVIAAPTVNALYSAAPNWNDYVKSSDPNTVCDSTETGGYTACIHGGEKRAVVVPGYSGCTNLSATDALAAFDWTCDDSTDPVRMVSTGLKSSMAISGTTDGVASSALINSAASFISDGIAAGDIVVNTSRYAVTTVVSVDSESQLSLVDDILTSGENYSISRQKYLSDLLDFAAVDWKDNAVSVKHGGTILFTTDPAKWLGNPIVLDNDGGSLATAGTVYLVTATPDANYLLEAGKIALIIEPGVTLMGAANDATTIAADTQNFLWLEGDVDATDNRVGVSLKFVNFSVLRNLQAENAYVNNQDTGIYIGDSLNNKLSNITATNNQYIGLNLRRASGNSLSFISSSNGSGSGLKIETNSDNNSLLNIMASGNGNYGVYLDKSSNNSLTNIVASNNGHEGISLDRASNENTLTNIIADNNVDNGVYIDGSSNNTLTNITASDNLWYGFSLVAGSNDNSVSNVTAINNGYYGVYLATSSNNNSLSEVTTINNGYYGVYLTSSSDNTLSNIAAANNNYGVWLSSALGNRLSNITASNNDQGVYLNGSSNNFLSDITTTNNGTSGVYLSGSSSNNSLSNITTSNNWLYGILFQSYTNNNSLANISANNNYIGVYLHNFSSYNSLSNISAANNSSDGVLIQNTSIDNSLSNIAIAHNGGSGVSIENNSSNNYFTGLLKVGDNASGDCYVLAESTSGDLQDDVGGVDTTHSGSCLTTTTALSDFTLTTGVTLASSFVGKVADDTANTTPHPNGVFAYGSITDWVNFENTYRGWGVDGGDFPDVGLSNRRQCASANCRIWDWSVDIDDTVIRAVLAGPDGNDIITHTWSDASTVTYLRNAVEMMGSGGNDNGLCETNETCLFTPNIGSYQGHGTLQSAGTFTGGTITGVTLMEYADNGY